MYQRILVPLDGSELAQVILPYIEELARTARAEIILLRVCEEYEDCTDPMHQAYLDRLAKSIPWRLGGRGDIIRSEVVRGHPAEEIMTYAEQNDVNLIAMATHGRSGISRWLMGSVASKVLSASGSPVLLVRPEILQKVTPEGWLRHNILVPLDGSSVAEWVLPHVGYLGKERGAEII